MYNRWNLIPQETRFNLNRHRSTVLLPGVLLRRLWSLLLFPSPCFSFTSANNVGIISFQGGCLSSHQAQEQRGGDGSGDSARRRYLVEPISGLHSWSSSFTAPPRQWSLWNSLKEKMEGKKVLVSFAHVKKHLKSYSKQKKKQNERGEKTCNKKKNKKNGRPGGNHPI